MRKLVLLFLGLLIGSSVWAVNYSEFPPPSSGSGGKTYSPKHFFVTVVSPVTWESLSSSKLQLSGGNIANYTTAECLRVVVYSSTARAGRIYDPVFHQFDYNQPTLEVVGVEFGTQESIRVEFIDSEFATNTQVVAKTIYTTTPVTITFTQTPKSFTVTNYSSADVIMVQTKAGTTWEVDPAIGAEREFRGLYINSIVIYAKTGTATAEVGVIY